MASMGGGRIGAALGATIVQLSDSAGDSLYEIKDSNGFVVFSVDSKGNIRHRGKIGRVSQS